MDSLYIKNQLAWKEDTDTYIQRKRYSTDWTILIPTIPGREASLQRLISSLRDMTQRICPQLKVDITLGFDDRKLSIGSKRQAMLQDAKGKYVSFIDDDDRVTPEYVEDAAQCIQGGFDCCRLRGQISQWTFTHSTENRLDRPMANKTTFLRPPNHLNVMKADIAKAVSFSDSSRGEDLEWTIKLARAGFLATEYRPDEQRIHYIYELGDRVLTPSVLERQQTMTYDHMLQEVLVAHQSPPPPRNEPSERVNVRLGPRGFVRT